MFDHFNTLLRGVLPTFGGKNFLKIAILGQDLGQK